MPERSWAEPNVTDDIEQTAANGTAMKSVLTSTERAVTSSSLASETCEVSGWRGGESLLRIPFRSIETLSGGFACAQPILDKIFPEKML